MKQAAMGGRYIDVTALDEDDDACEEMIGLVSVDGTMRRVLYLSREDGMALREICDRPLRFTVIDHEGRKLRISVREQ